MSAPRKARGAPAEGVDAEPDLERHHGGVADPTGAVSSGLQPGPMRQRDAEMIERSKKDTLGEEE